MEKHPDDEIDDIIWSEIESSDSKGDFICYVIHSPTNAKFLENAKARIDTKPDPDSLIPVKYFNAIKRIEELARKNNAVASFHMGKIHALGIAVPQNLAEGIHWYEKAVELGEPRAYANLGWLYQSGHGVIKNPLKAFELLSYAAKHGILSAKAAIGIMLLKGEHAEPDSATGLQKLEEAFNEGYLNAGNHLSDIYFEGKYVKRNIELAHRWLWNVVHGGDERSMAILGHYLITGSHGKKDPDTGLMLMNKAIELQFLPAYLWLGTLYKNGNGIEQNIKKALDLFRKGVLAGNKDCEKAISILLAEQNITGTSTPKLFH